MRRRRAKSLQQRFTEKYTVDPATGCWTWTAYTDKNGYGGINIDGKCKFATHVALMLAGRPVPNGFGACHHCDNPSCVNPDHMFIGTQADNVRDAMQKGRATKPPIRRGEKNNRAVLNAAIVTEMRALFQSGMSRKKIARHFGVSECAARYVINGKTWVHV